MMDKYRKARVSKSEHHVAHSKQYSTTRGNSDDLAEIF